MGDSAAPTIPDSNRILSAEGELRRCLLAHILWDRDFFEQGCPVVERLRSLIPRVPAENVAKLAIESRKQLNIRQGSLLLVREMARLRSHRTVVAKALAEVIQEPEELSDFVSIYWRDGKQPLSAQVKKGLSAGFAKFGGSAVCERQNRSAIPLKDILFLCHAKPQDLGQEVMWRKLADQRRTNDRRRHALPSDDGDREVWEHMPNEHLPDAKLLLQNLHKLGTAKVPQRLVRHSIDCLKSTVLPFDFLIASRLVPKCRLELEQAMLKAVRQQPLLTKTSIVVNIAAPQAPVSKGNLLLRGEAAAGLAVLLSAAKESCVYKGSLGPLLMRHGFELTDALAETASGSTAGSSHEVLVQLVRNKERIILITDQPRRLRLPIPSAPSYLINLRSKRNCISYGTWVRLDGWSEHLVAYIHAAESGLHTKDDRAKAS